MSKDLKVHLDHLIKRQNLRYTKPKKLEHSEFHSPQKSDSNIRFSDIQQEEGWFSRLVKPDFQRATSAWTPDGCADFLNSVVRRRIIPSIILWRNDETGLVYVLDGAHRLSVLRAWMTDDWGDKANDFYAKSENHTEIITAAHEARELINKKVGAFMDFSEAAKELWEITDKGEAPLRKMSTQRFGMAKFYTDIVHSSRTLHAQWEAGNYEAAEESFLAINRQGAPLDDLESNLIEYRNGSFSRITMSIANAGAPGHYWPKPTSTDELSKHVIDLASSFDNRCHTLHNILFVPPFDTKIKDINVPFMVAPGHFRKHQHLVEALPLLSDGITATKESLPNLLSKDYKSSAENIILNAEATLTKLEDKISHLSNNENNPNSLSLVPLIYWYNKQGSYVRALFYGFCHWLLSGSSEDIKMRKIAFSAVRGELELVFINYKNEFSDIQHRGGAGLKSTFKIASAIQDIIEVLINTESTEETSSKIKKIFGKPQTLDKKENTGRSFTIRTKAEINIREMLTSSIKCQICEGVLDLKQSVQYDHIDHYSKSFNSAPSNGRPTHPFCNLFREKISSIRKKDSVISLPPLKPENTKANNAIQLSLFDSFPGF
ncbi:GmrSD restriction endonuclease domain-containing protein [Pseudomonas viridiflava]|uniref:GmrSD restriction endonuclease domain-containing protein n=1 Tax=Pseudomonas viridiflava TaxID=33069 RepID=UPI000F02B7EA|nr:DUF262 domain-containing protein [Pseudomonas viridiflava]